MADEQPINYTISTKQIRPENLPPPPPLLLQRTPVVGQSIAPPQTIPIHQPSHQGNNGTNKSSSQLQNDVTKEDLNAGRHEPNLRDKYAQLLLMIDDMSKDLKQAYTGSKSSTERLKRSVNQTKVLVRDLINESERRSLK